MTRVFVEFDPPRPNGPDFTSDSSDLVYFLSWAYATRYGATHELSLVALALRNDFKVDLSPLLTFADRAVEDEADAEALERAWQDAVPLAECCRQVTQAFASGDTVLEEVEVQYPALRASIEELGQIAAWAAARGARVRITYELSI